MTYPRYEFFVRYMICICFLPDFDLPIHFLSFFFFLWLHCVAHGILVIQPGIKPVPPAVEVGSLHHWISRKSLHSVFQQTLSLRKEGRLKLLVNFLVSKYRVMPTRPLELSP